MKNLPKIIPVFPLSNFIIFPHTTVPLNIFEPRYVEMIQDSIKTNKLIGLVQPKNNYDGSRSLTSGPAGCNTNIPSNVSGLCFCKDGSIKARVDCGHTNFNCNEVCQPQGKPYI